MVCGKDSVDHEMTTTHDVSHWITIGFLANVLKHGKKGEIGLMPSFEYLNLSQKEVEALQSFIAAKQKIQ